jgi:hypothetical protein
VPSVIKLLGSLFAEDMYEKKVLDQPQFNILLNCKRAGLYSIGQQWCGKNGEKPVSYLHRTMQQFYPPKIDLYLVGKILGFVEACKLLMWVKK